MTNPVHEALFKQLREHASGRCPKGDGCAFVGLSHHVALELSQAIDAHARVPGAAITLSEIEMEKIANALLLSKRRVTAENDYVERTFIYRVIDAVLDALNEGKP